MESDLEVISYDLQDSVSDLEGNLLVSSEESVEMDQVEEPVSFEFDYDRLETMLLSASPSVSSLETALDDLSVTDTVLLLVLLAILIFLVGRD